MPNRAQHHNRTERRLPSWLRDEQLFVWRAAHSEALAAYRAWAASPGRPAYAVYRAAQDRADQAQEALAFAHAG